MRTFRIPALLLAAVVALAGCGRGAADNPLAPDVNDTSDDFSVERTEIEAGSLEANGLSFFGISRVLFTHASPDAPAVDINLGIQPVARDLEFGDNTRYRFTWSGNRRVIVKIANTDDRVLSARVRLAPWTFYSVFAINEAAKLEPLVLVDDLSRPAKGNTHVRFIHLSPNAPAVDVAVANGGPVVFGDKEFMDATDFTPLPAGTYDLEVRLAGTDAVVLPLPGVTLAEGAIYTVYAKGFVGGTGDQALGAGVIVNSQERRWWRRASRLPAEAPALGG